MTNILSGCAATSCHRTWHFEYGASVPGGPFPGTHARAGDVRRCEHGKVWLFHRLAPHGSWFDMWERIHPLSEPIVYRRAIRALARKEDS